MWSHEHMPKKKKWDSGTEIPEFENKNSKK